MDELLSLKNVGKATRQDFADLGIESRAQLAKQDPRQLYDRLCQLKGQRIDPCQLDVFMATVHECKTGEAKVWWDFTPERKRLNPGL